MQSKKSGPTLRDIARRMNLSVTTISKVINNHSDISDKTKKEVMDTIHEMGYVSNFMASNLRRRRGKMVGLILSDISKPYFSKVIYGYESTFSKAGFQTLIFNSFEDTDKELEFIRQVASLNVAGIVLDMAQNSTESIPLMKELNIPFVLSNRYSSQEDSNYVVADNRMAGKIATAHLLERKPGCPVLCINGPDNISPTIDRQAGYMDALNEAGIPICPEYILNNHFGLQDAYKSATDVIKNVDPPFSVFCSTDQIALGFMRGLHELGLRVPEDVGVIGVDDIETAAFSVPSLSTVMLPKERMGRYSAEMLIKMIKGEHIGRPRIRMMPRLTIREST